MIKELKLIAIAAILAASMAACTNTTAVVKSDASKNLVAQIVVAKVIEESKDPKATAAKLLSGTKLYLNQDNEVPIVDIKAKLNYDKASVSEQIAIDGLLEAIQADIDAVQLEYKSETLDRWVGIIYSVASRFVEK